MIEDDNSQIIKITTILVIVLSCNFCSMLFQSVFFSFRVTATFVGRWNWNRGWLRDGREEHRSDEALTVGPRGLSVKLFRFVT